MVQLHLGAPLWRNSRVIIDAPFSERGWRRSCAVKRTCSVRASRRVVFSVPLCRVFFESSLTLGLMEVSQSIQCPFCGSSFELTIDTGVPNQRFTTDCEICCRPFEVEAECEPGEILSLVVLGG